MGGFLKPIRVLVTGAGAPGAAGIIKSLRLNGERQIHIVTCDMNSNSAGFYLAEKAFVVPPGKSETFIPRIYDIVQSERIDVIIPLTTDELMPFSSNKRNFLDIGTAITVSDPEQLEVANDKGKLYSFLSNIPVQNGIVPQFIIVDSLKQFRSAISELGYPTLPVCFKPTDGKGGRGFRILDSRIDRLDLLLHHKPDNTCADLGEIVSILKEAKPFPELVVMEYLPGKEYSVDLLARGGNSLVTIPRRRDAIKMGISFIGTVEENKELSDHAEAIVKTLDLDYCINMQFKYDRFESPKIIEINPRVSGTIIMATGAGVNLPYMAVKLALNEDVVNVQPRYHLRMLRFWDEVFVNDSGGSFRLKDEQD